MIQLRAPGLFVLKLVALFPTLLLFMPADFPLNSVFLYLLEYLQAYYLGIVQCFSLHQSEREREIDGRGTSCLELIGPLVSIPDYHIMLYCFFFCTNPFPVKIAYDSKLKHCSWRAFLPPLM